MESELYGTNLCNILVNEIIKEFSKIDKNHVTDIVLCDLSQFIVLRGKLHYRILSITHRFLIHL